MYDIFFQPVKSIILMKEVAEKALKRLGIFNVRDLVFYKPYSYNISDISPNLSSLRDNSLIQVEVSIVEILQSRSARSPTKIYVSNDTGGLTLVFFNRIPSFIFNRLKIGAKVTIHGKVQYFDGGFQITHPEFIFNKSLSVPVEPVYHLTYGLINKQLYSYILTAIKSLEILLLAIPNNTATPKNDVMLRLRGIQKKQMLDSAWSGNDGKRSRNDIGIYEKPLEYTLSLIEEIKALHLVSHLPRLALIEQTLETATSKLAAKELFANQVSLAKLKRKEQQVHGRKFSIASGIKDKVLNNLEFKLTPAQEQVMEEIEADQTSNIQMMRLLQGDVGSGKTLVALLTMINVANYGAQAVLMVPTDLLSMQHYQFFTKALSGTGISCALLTGKTSAKERKIIKENLENGVINILIGTHALFQEAVVFKDLGYVVIDEQHRFGVEQRLELIAKATHPDVLVMTATPIPRSLTLTMFGDMSVSHVKTKPQNRLPIITTITNSSKREQVVMSLQKMIDRGEKIYWVCPLIDQSDKTLEHEDDFTYSDVSARYKELDMLYPNQVAILHGKMKPIDKDSVMQKFKDGEVKILVATTVIEVGIDVYDATLVIVENAEKFGLAQLHQLRGRVGRGHLQSYCVLIYNPKRFSAIARRRLEIMRQSHDGFYIAQQDLILRGGGEILGTKQSGEPEFFFANLGRDLNILLEANKLAQNAKFSEFTEFQTKLFARDRENLAKSG